MELLLILIYVALCIAIFKIFRIPVNQWTLATAALGGIAGIALMLLTMNYNHPFTSNARIYYAVTPILPSVPGRVVDVPVEPNVPLKEGDILFKIDPVPYQLAVDEKSAELAEAEQNVKQLGAALEQATAATGRAKAQAQQAQSAYDRNVTLFEGGVIAAAMLDIHKRNLDTANQSLAMAEAEERQANLAYSSNISGTHTLIATLTAELGSAKYDLDQSVTRAPGPGFVTQLALRPGMYVVPAPLRPVMVFVYTDKSAGELLTAAFQQNALQRVRAGDEAEVAFYAVPGRVFKWKVHVVVDAIPEGQLEPTGSLIDPGSLPGGGGRALAMIDIEDSLLDYQIPLGAAAEVAIYTDHIHELSLIRKVLLRMKSWQNFIFSEHFQGGH
jgi:multidrug resistance efflux pump